MTARSVIYRGTWTVPYRWPQSARRTKKPPGAVLVERGVFERHLYVQITVHELSESDDPALPFTGLEVVVLEPREELRFTLVAGMADIERVLVAALADAQYSQERAVVSTIERASQAGLAALMQWLGGGAPMPRRELVRLLLERLRIEESRDGLAQLRLHGTPAQQTCDLCCCRRSPSRDRIASPCFSAFPARHSTYPSFARTELSSHLSLLRIHSRIRTPLFAPPHHLYTTSTQRRPQTRSST